MQSTVTEIAPDLFRLSTFHPDFGIQFNQFVLRDDEPFLMHTCMKKMFSTTLEAVRTVLDPAKLRWIGFSHFESDECGALNDWLRIAPAAQALCSFVGARVMVNDFADRAPRVLMDDEVLVTGRHRLRFLQTPNVPHAWDAGLFYDEVERALLCSDLFFHPGDPAPLIESDVVGPARDAILSNLSGPMAHDIPYTAHTDATLRRLAALEPRVFAIMHGSSFRGDGKTAMLDLAKVFAEALGEGVTPAG
jgi:flavorubredoxin